MFLLKRPQAAFIEQVVQDQRGRAFTYEHVGATRDYETPPGFSSNQRRFVIGADTAAYERACEALKAWRMLSLGWLQPVATQSPPEENAMIATLARSMSLYTLNVGRVIYVEEKPLGASGGSYSIGYGTLPEYPLCGEERFTVTLDAATAEVAFEVFSFSKPSSWLVAAGGFHIRRLQQRFCEDAAAAMRSACRP